MTILDGEMRIKELVITGLGGIPYLSLSDLNPHMNIICGENGVGKTNILDAITTCFSHYKLNRLKKQFGVDSGNIRVKVQDGEESKDVEMSIADFEPVDAMVQVIGQGQEFSKSLMYLPADRKIQYKSSTGLPKDRRLDQDLYIFHDGISDEDLKSWFISRNLISHQPVTSLTDAQKEITNLAVSFFSVIDERVSFKTITANYDILLATPTGDIYFEYMSSGFKSIFFVLLGILKELDLRFKDKEVLPAQFYGVILIDEIELHLHPEWQAKICEILRTAFPEAQFFITTHSPHVVQSAKSGEIISLQRQVDQESGNSQVFARELIGGNSYAFQGWTIEEILEDVMGMKSTRSEEFELAMQRFDDALDTSNKIEAQKAYSTLSEMLHPSSHVKKLLRLQMAGLR